VAVFLAAVSLAASASPAGASVTLGQLAPNPVQSCNIEPRDHLQPTVTSGNTYVVPGTGTITSWGHNAGPEMGATLTMKVFRKVADPATYMAVGHDGPRVILYGPSVLNSFPVSIPVKPGDVLGLNQKSPFNTACIFGVAGESHLAGLGLETDLADGESGDFRPFGVPSRLNLTAVFVYSNSFTLGRITRNKKKGTATLTVDVPNPGDLTAKGKGVKAAGAAVISKTVTAPGAVELLIAAKGKKKRKLNKTGRMKLNANITYTPTGGDPSTQSIKVKLKKKL